MKKRGFTVLLMVADGFAINLAFLLAFFLRFDGGFVTNPQSARYFEMYMQSCINITTINLVIFYLFGMYNSLWKYASVEELLQVVFTSAMATAATISYMFIMSSHLPRSLFIMTFILNIVFVGGIRFSYRGLRRMKNNRERFSKETTRVMVIGAGEAGASVIKELKNHDELKSRAVALIDDDDMKLGRKINGVPVLGDRYHIKKIADKKDIDEIILAVPSSSKREIRDILEECSKTKCKLKIVPGIFELIDGQVNIQEIRDVDIEDLLGRDPVKVDLEGISGYIQRKCVMISGGGGSIGSELSRQIATFNPRKIVILDIYENNAYDIQNELKRNDPTLDLEVVIASVRDRKRLEEVFDYYGPDVVFHAAAHKHVPLMESNPQEAIKNNVFGTLNMVECADQFGVEKFVLISTDKAVNPTNVMGATKRITEMIAQSMSKRSDTEFVAVRFGNVLGSNGSVIPLFRDQIKSGGPVTVTHADVTRFFMTIPEAAQLVIQAGAMASGGEIFVLDMGEPVKIMDLAEKLVRLSGFEPYVDMDIEVTGLRPGEKLYEELLMSEEGLTETSHHKIFIGQPLYVDYKVLMAELDQLRAVVSDENEDIKSHIEHMVPTYRRIG